MKQAESASRAAEMFMKVCHICRNNFFPPFFKWALFSCKCIWLMQFYRTAALEIVLALVMSVSHFQPKLEDQIHSFILWLPHTLDIPDNIRCYLVAFSFTASTFYFQQLKWKQSWRKPRRRPMQPKRYLLCFPRIGWWKKTEDLWIEKLSINFKLICRIWTAWSHRARALPRSMTGWIFVKQIQISVWNLHK